RRHHLPDILVLFALRPLLGDPAIALAEGLSHQRVGARLAQFGLQRFHQRNEHLRLDLCLLDDGSGHVWSPLMVHSVIASDLSAEANRTFSTRGEKASKINRGLL